MGVRKIQPNFWSITGLHGASGQEFESKLEADLMILQQFDTDVDHFESQPLTISYTDQPGTTRTYTPDLLVHYKPGTAKLPLLCEVKYRDEYREKFSRLRPKFKAALRFAKANGMRFRVITDREIRTPYLENARFLLRYRNMAPDPSHVRILLDTLAKHVESSPGLLLSAISQEKIVQAELLPTLWHLIANYVIQADLSDRLTMESGIRFESQGTAYAN